MSSHIITHTCPLTNKVIEINKCFYSHGTLFNRYPPIFDLIPSSRIFLKIFSSIVLSIPFIKKYWGRLERQSATRSLARRLAAFRYSRGSADESWQRPSQQVLISFLTPNVEYPLCINVLYYHKTQSRIIDFFLTGHLFYFNISWITSN